MSEYTDDQIEGAIRSALTAGNSEAVVGLIALLALQNPKRAEVIRDTILLGIAVAADNPKE